MRPTFALSFCLIAAITLSACGEAEAPTSVSQPDTGGLTQAEEAAGVPLMPDDAPPQEEAVAEPALAGSADGDCLAAIGKPAADRLVERCIAVSPATRPPCNVANPCEMIQGEIDRSCAMYGEQEARPAECSA